MLQSMRVGVFSAVAVLAAGCSTTTSTTPGTAPSPSSTSTPASQTLSRAETITWALGIDPCALIEPSHLEVLGTVKAIGTSSNSTSCEALVDDGTTRGIDVSWSIAFSPFDFLTSSLGELDEIDGVKARRIDAATALAPEVRDQLVESACNYDVAFENEIAVRMRVSMERDRDACATADPLARAVIATWPEHPTQGSSPHTSVTALTDSAPCAVVPKLQESRTVSFDWKDQSLTSCFFTVDAVEVLVTFDYQTHEVVAADGEPTKFGNHDGYHKVHEGTTFADAVVGDGFDGVDAARPSRLVPVVAVNGDDAAVVFDVTTAVLNQLPH
ncbi:DUF3558 family protein [Mycobacterium sp. DL440]|uniref:DUF3558 family protein n=1 Tax=Mycobacterium sp. DL440 TaxID=2675523 RepID=UPI001422B9BD|nr:DUF3558 family protein [Mycobacterium sp. DL440]